MRETQGSALNRVIIYYLETSTHLLIFFLEELALPPRCVCSACLFCNEVTAYSYRVAILPMNCVGRCERRNRVYRTLRVL